MRTQPRESGRRLQTLGVMAGNVCSGSPNLSSDSGCTCHSMFAVGLARIAPAECAKLGRRHRERPGLEYRILERHRRFSEQAVRALVQRRGVLHLVLHPDLQMVVQVRADAGEIVDRRDAARRDERRRAHARELQQLRRSDTARGQDRFAARLRETLAVARVGELDAFGAQDAISAADAHAFDQRLGDDREIRPRQHRPEKGFRGVPAHAALLVHLEVGAAEVVAPIELADLRNAAFLGRVAPGLENLPPEARVLDAKLAARRHACRRRRADSPRPS